MATFVGCAPQNFMTGREGQPVDLVVIHTMVGSTEGATARFNDGTQQASAHYGVSLDGSLTQWVQESDTAYHAGDWPVNLRSIGIEHEDQWPRNLDGSLGPEPTRPDALYQFSSQLVRDICERYSIPIDRDHIRKHSEVSDHPTACPDALDIDRIVAIAGNPAQAGWNGQPDPAPAPAPSPPAPTGPDRSIHYATPDQVWTGTVDVGRLNVREAPTTDALAYYQLSQGDVRQFDAWIHGDTVYVDAITGQGDDRWFHISADLDPRQGWVASAYVNGNPTF